MEAPASHAILLCTELRQVKSARWDFANNKEAHPESVSLKPDELASVFLTGSGGSTRKKPFKWKSKHIVERR
jgi:hypothetical protein